MSGARKSKSGIILDLGDPKLHDKTVAIVLSNPRLRIPRKLLFKEGIEKWRDYITSHKCRKYYRYLDPLPEENLEGLSALEMLYALGPRRAKVELEKILLPKEQVFPNAQMEIFYLSCYAYKTGEPEDESRLFRALLKHHGSGDRTILRNVFIRFSNMTVLRYLKSEIMNTKGAFRFLRFVAPKLGCNIIELWFNEGFSYDSEIFRQMNILCITPETKFNCSLFEQFLELDAFRKHVFNFWRNEEFLLKMGDYINRGDYAYYYSSNGVPYAPLVKLSSDYQEYEFFSNFSISDQRKLRNYQVRHGTNLVLMLLLEGEIDRLLDSIGTVDLDIIIDAIKCNERAMNMKIWDRLKNEENIFRRLVGCFPDPCDISLHGLLTGNYAAVRSEDAEKWIRVCYEDELLEYFKDEPVSGLLKIANSWNQEFFLDAFLAKLMRSNSEGFTADDKSILDFVASRAFKDTFKAARVLDRLFKISSKDIYNQISMNLKFIYTLRHREFSGVYLQEMNAGSLSVLDKAHIHELGPAKEYFVDNNNLISSLYEISFVSKRDFRYYFVEYFSALSSFIHKHVDRARLEVMIDFQNNAFFSEPEGSGADRINFYLKLEKSNFDDVFAQLLFIFGLGLSNRYTVFILFNEIVECLTGNSNAMKMLILRFLDPSLVSKGNLLLFFNSLIPLLNSPNAKICEMARSCLQKIDIETQEIQNILSVLVQALSDKQHATAFVKAFRSILFNNYLCFNSVNLVMQVLFKHINEYPEEMLEIIGKIVNISKGEDLEHIGRLVFSKLSKYVIANHYHTTNALWAAKPYCMYAFFDDYKPLIEHFSAPRLCQYTVGLLKTRGSPDLNRTIIEYVLGIDRSGENREAHPVPYPFIASACELNEFSIYFDTFLPTLESLFVSGDSPKRTAALKAFSEVLSEGRACFSQEVKEHVTLFVIKCAIFEDYYVRLACLDVIEYLPLLFIMKNDQHAQVRKKAYDLWKKHVEHPNRTLKIIFWEVLDLIRFSRSAVFKESVRAAVAEMSAKYPVYLEQYIREDGPSTALGESSEQNKFSYRNLTGIPGKIQSEDALTRGEIKEFILLEALRNNKLFDLAFAFIVENNFSSTLFNLLYRHESYRNRLISKVPAKRLMRQCKDNPGLSMALYKDTGDTELLPYIDDADILGILRELEPKCDFGGYLKGGDSYTDKIRAALAYAKPSAAVEEFVLQGHSILSYFYLYILSGSIPGKWPDFGLLGSIFQRAFELSPRLIPDSGTCDVNMDSLVTRDTLAYVKRCSFGCVSNKIELLRLLLCEDDRTSFERITELVLAGCISQDVVFDVLGYLLRNYLADTRRDECHNPLILIYNDPSLELGYFKSIIEKSIFALK